MPGLKPLIKQWRLYFSDASRPRSPLLLGVVNDALGPRTFHVAGRECQGPSGGSDVFTAGPESRVLA